ncbi:proteasome endopeptidase complex, archaeal, beta subunit [Pyrococcus furiosus DSM 3638]|uniref:Proteasome subunit beta 2 n=2 Tax=Pyrococcus furiosus (strain ATCC 43587 / DSM 3638 / JCM 8422 / Vc1) TaxID=186497 RepID=PSB2_PYRFU|nr:MULTISPECIES: archaeal proteasome endopeptidase complex subunit beta [Pyrococcus]Q8U125.1 RecName: Full=Proteasome subunit beta 2; AltName: Full=20S proteasome beta subunit 2; AltName: Full=Proteasome core protein PsmB 2; Flags: Precursor [Pyrococcus furiosus DSM 3638]AAL81528.1 proteasome, subunit beta (multicatalytic endopeptidase complex beta subunit) [Pyrococcus furiosus DSM 3638]MDK2868872.1 proteasome beta subunit [Pyrococcus sp.]QEK79036.1 proteasome endopeptidase complex, archaeal, b
MLHLKEKLKGTTTVGLVCKEGVVLAADTRASLGNIIYAKNVTKIHKIDEHLAIAGAGDVGDILNLVRLLKAEANLYKSTVGKEMSVKALATLLANILNGSKYFPYLGWFLVGGYDEKPRLFSVDMVGGITEDNYAAAGSGMEFAYSILDSEYREEMSVNDGIKLAVKAINVAIKRDVFTGDGLLVVTITKDGYKEYRGAELEKMLK